MKTITIVTGLPRSGTSMMMRLLEHNGIECMYDDKKNEHNPNGYYESKIAKKIKDDNTFLETLNKKAVKLMASRIKHLPENHKYNIILMERDADEIVTSQQKMKKSEITDSHRIFLCDAFRNAIIALQEKLEKMENVNYVVINYNNLFSDVENEIKKLEKFLKKDIDYEGMIDEKLYRNKNI